jgi:P4 family phage/plasmid primase-like protien
LAILSENPEHGNPNDHPQHDVESILCGAHLAELRASGLTDETILATGIYTEHDADRIKVILNWKASRRQWPHGAALVFPFRDASGNPMAGYKRLKLMYPRQSKASKLKPAKIIKYESPMGNRNHAYFPPGFADLIQDLSSHIFITEGEKKTLKLWQETKRLVIGLVGVWGFSLRRERDAAGKAIGDRKLLPELEQIVWQGRIVYIVFDSDAWHNPDVRLAEVALVEELTKRGAIVRVVRLPDGTPGPDGLPKKQGIDDYLVVNPVDEFLKLLDAADQVKPLGCGEVACEAADDPDRLAKLWLDVEGSNAAGERTIRRHREAWQRHDGTVYREVADDEIRASVHRLVKQEFDGIAIEIAANWEGEGKPPEAIKVGRGLITNVLEAIQSRVIVSGDVELPIWLDAGIGRSKNVLAMDNGLIDLTAFLDDRCEIMLPHSANWFSITKFPYIIDPQASCPKWMAFLDRNLEGDAQRISIVQEWFGLNIVHDTTFHKFFVMEGDGANGKSVICAVLEAMLGKDNCAFVPLEIFAQRFQLTPTVGKLANIVPECGEIDRVAEGILKSFVSGDSMTFDRKNKTPLQCTATARLTLAFNNRPRFSDRTTGLWRRMILMPMRVTIPPEERVKGMDKPEWWKAQDELPGVFCWSLVGLARLRRQGGFTRSSVCDDALADYMTECNPTRFFFAEICKKDASVGVVCDSLYELYKTWMAKNGYVPLGSGKFGAEIKRQFPRIERKQRTHSIRGRVWCYMGVSAGGAELCAAGSA